MKNTISKTSKLDGIKSWSLQALETCPGSVGENGQLVAACSGCYATTGMYHFGAVKAVRANNKEAWQSEHWVGSMIMELQNSRYFRWFDSGDMYSLDLAEKIYQVMEQTPWISHWLPTRMAKFSKFSAIIDKMKSLDNVAVRFSSDSINGEFTPGIHGSTIVRDSENVPAGVTLCEAYSHGGKCNGCRACYDKAVPVIGYPAHGKKMAKVIRISTAA
jgi:Gene product 88